MKRRQHIQKIRPDVRKAHNRPTDVDLVVCPSSGASSHIKHDYSRSLAKHQVLAAALMTCAASVPVAGRLSDRDRGVDRSDDLNPGNKEANDSVSAY